LVKTAVNLAKSVKRKSISKAISGRMKLDHMKFLVEHKLFSFLLFNDKGTYKEVNIWN
jgi:hypothetical protein